jgi:hypothetical protein
MRMSLLFKRRRRNPEEGGILGLERGQKMGLFRLIWGLCIDKYKEGSREWMQILSLEVAETMKTIY